MSADGGSVRNPLESQSSTSSSGSTTDSTRRRKNYGKNDRKIIRILTVVAYVISVSTAAVLLSAYYVFLWSPELPVEKKFPIALQITQAAAVSPSNDTRVMVSKLAEPSFALSASQIGPKPIRKKKFYLHYVNSNTKAYQQHQIPTPPSTFVMITKILTMIPPQKTTPISIAKEKSSP